MSHHKVSYGSNKISSGKAEIKIRESENVLVFSSGEARCTFMLAQNIKCTCRH